MIIKQLSKLYMQWRVVNKVTSLQKENVGGNGKSISKSMSKIILAHLNLILLEGNNTRDLVPYWVFLAI